MLSGAIDRVKRVLGSSSGDDDGTARRDDERDGPDLYECEGCGTVFISEPPDCSNCGGEEFSNVGRFE